MNTSPLTRETSVSITPETISAYLRSHDWTLVGYIGRTATLWRREGGGTLQVPADTTFADYALRLAEIFDTISKEEGRPTAGIIHDVTHPPEKIPLFSADPITTDIAPLIRAISQGNAVVFVGAGVSQSSGLPGWESLLSDCLAKAVHHSTIPGEWDKALNLMAEKNYLMVAELLHKGLGPEQLGGYLAAAIGDNSLPSRLHHAIARIPFSLALTTNYDSLLEQAVHPSPSTIFTWQETKGIFDAISSSQEKFLNNLATSREFGKQPLGRPLPSFPIIKNHGDLTKSNTIVLTRSQYRDLAHQNKAFNECIKALLAFRTVLFVGCSLTDPDILALMDEIRMVHGTSGLHYAIVSKTMMDSRYEAFLRESFNIHTIAYDAALYDAPQAGAPSADNRATLEHRRKKRSSPDIVREDPRTTAVFEILKSISGRAALAIQARASVLKFGHPLFNRLDACKLLLTHACEITGSAYGDICIVTSPHSRQLVRVCSYPSPTGQQDSRWNVVRHNSITGALFMQRKVNEDYIYIPNVANAEAYLGRYGSSTCRDNWGTGVGDDTNTAPSCDQNQDDAMCPAYQPCHRDVRCELACPILADGECIGVLNLESTIEDAYTRDHLEVARGVATEIGAAYVAARRRAEAGHGLDACLFGPDDSPPSTRNGAAREDFKNCSPLQNLITSDPLMGDQHLHFLIWERDCEEGLFIPNYCPCGVCARSPHNDDDSSESCSLDACPPEMKKGLKEFRYKFSDTALVVSCYTERRRLAVKDALAASSKAGGSVLNPEGVKMFGITGPVTAHPIRSRGHLAGVLVCWRAKEYYDDPKGGEIGQLLQRDSGGLPLTDAEKNVLKRSEEKLLQATERTHRILDVLANIPAKGLDGTFKRGNNAESDNDKPNKSRPDAYNTQMVYHYVQKLIDLKGSDQPNAKGHKRAAALLAALVNGEIMAAPFGRARLWLQEDAEDAKNGEDVVYRCVAAEYAAGYEPDKAVQKEVLKATSPPDDIWGNYTRRRAPTDPYARLQYPSLLGGQVDKNAAKLGKDPDGAWIVGPIITSEIITSADPLNPFEETYRMLGFISVDCHKLEEPTSKAPGKSGATQKKSDEGPKDQIKPHLDEQLLRFQRRIVDLATSLIAEIYAPAPAPSKSTKPVRRRGVTL